MRLVALGVASTVALAVAVATFFWLERGRLSSGPGSSAAAVAPEKRPWPVENEDYFVGARPVGIPVAPNQRPYLLV